MKVINYLFGALVIGALLCCVSCTKKEKTIAGVALGAAAGAGIGAAVGNTGGAAVGAVVGGASGGLIGHSMGDGEK